MVEITMKYIFLAIQITITFSKRLFGGYSVPACKNCIFFKRSISFPNFNHLAYCTQFGENNTHKHALECRIDENKCGIVGKCFHERKVGENIFKNITIPTLHKTITIMMVVMSIIIRSIFS